jgi:hypothetical protein
MFENYIKFSVKITFDKNNKKKVTGHKKDWQKLNESRYKGRSNSTAGKDDQQNILQQYYLIYPIYPIIVYIFSYIYS